MHHPDEILQAYVFARDSGCVGVGRLEQRALLAHHHLASAAAARGRRTLGPGEAEQAALIGLLFALRSWSPSGGSTLRQWARIKMLAEIRAAERELATVEIPRAQLMRRAAAAAARALLVRNGDGEPSPEQVAQASRLSSSVAQRLLLAPVDRIEVDDSTSAPAPAMESILDARRAVAAASLTKPRDVAVALDVLVLGRTVSEIARSLDRSRQTTERIYRRGLAALVHATSPELSQ